MTAHLLSHLVNEAGFPRGVINILHGKGANPIGVSQIDAHGWLVLAIGFAVSFIVAYAVS